MEKVAAVLVTYNRKELLMECVNGLLGQTRKPDAILIADNRSTDGTEKALRESGIINTLPDLDSEKDETIENTTLNPNGEPVKIIYIRKKENDGGAGGFHFGVKLGHKLGYDWLWLMDDDVEPEADCLENLLELSRKENSQCLHPVKYFPDGEEQYWEGKFDHVTGKIDFVNNISFRQGKEVCTVNYGCFEGMLVHKDIVDKIGYPIKDFFVCYDDRSYGYLASKFTKVVFTKKAALKKKIDSRNSASQNYQYYSLRNYFLLFKLLPTKNIRESLVRKTFIGSLYIKKSLKALLKRDIALFTLLFKSLKDGFQSEFGKRS